MVDFTNHEIGRLKVTGWAFKKNDRWQWICGCSCGKTVVVPHVCLLKDNTRSCGCLQKEHASRNARKAIAARTKHGESKTVEWVTWKDMRQRCNNPNIRTYARYGGRGIKVCDRWEDEENGYRNFLQDMGRRPSPAHSLHRIDNDGGYTPENCEWVTSSVQQRNRCNSHFLTAWGRKQTVAAWAEETGIPYSVISQRAFAGWTPEVNLSTPPAFRTPRKKP